MRPGGTAFLRSMRTTPLEDSVQHLSQPALARVVTIANGKGGVGKSSMTVNIATALAAKGLNVGVLDADIYGHSVPNLLGCTDGPTVLDDEMLLPPISHGIKHISIGQFVEGNAPVVWRGPMLHRALQQFLADVFWGDLDVLLVSPERLANPGFGRRVLDALAGEIGLLVIDEAHAISDWGHDFRPDYRRVSDVLQSLNPQTPVLATTATANSRVTDDVAAQLSGGGQQSETLVLRGPLARSSLHLNVIDGLSPIDRYGWVAQHLPELPGSGIVYVLTVADGPRDTLTVLGESVEHGRVREVLERPRSAFTAGLAGVNLLRAEGRAGGGAIAGEVEIATGPHQIAGPCWVTFAPDAVSLHDDHPEGSPRNVWRSRVTRVEAHAGRVRVRLDSPFAMSAEVTPAALAALPLRPGDRVWASVKATQVRVHPATVTADNRP